MINIAHQAEIIMQNLMSDMKSLLKFNERVEKNALFKKTSFSRRSPRIPMWKLLEKETIV